MQDVCVCCDNMDAGVVAQRHLYHYLTDRCPISRIFTEGYPYSEL
jgi:hypothetical protein